MMTKKRIIYIPLDSRPCNSKWPVQLASMIGQALVLPPLELMDYYKKPADPDKILEWLAASLSDASVAVIALDLLLYGGLVSSRNTEIELSVIKQRLSTIAKIIGSNKNIKFYLYSTILHSLSKPDQALRKRNFEINKEILLLNKFSNIEILLFGKDDVSLGDKAVLEEQNYLANHGGLVLCGADEIGVCLLARAFLKTFYLVPKIIYEICYPETFDKFSLYEDESVQQILEKHMAFLGVDMAEDIDTADIALFVNNFEANQEDIFLDHPNFEDVIPAQAGIHAFLEFVNSHKLVALADVAYANGADPKFMQALADKIKFSDLAGFSGWNTTANTIGAALAGAVISWIGQKKGLLNKGLKDKYVLARIVEDWFYQSIVRQQIKDELIKNNVSVTNLGGYKAQAEKQLKKQVDNLISKHKFISGDYTAGFPWPRIFEADIIL